MKGSPDIHDSRDHAAITGPACGDGLLPRRPAAALGTLLLGVVTALAACGPADDGVPAEDDGEARAGSASAVVMVSVPPQAWLAERLAGPEADVAVMIPAGANPHTYEPTMGQMRRLSDATLYFAVGHPAFPFERAWLGELKRANPTMRVVETGSGCASGAEDHHVWLSPVCAEEMAGAMAGALADEFPDGREEIEARLEALREEIRGVDREVEEILAPHRGRAFLVFHPAWGHFAGRYGLEQIAVEAHGRDPGARQMGEVLRRARDAEVRVVFLQPQFSREMVEVVARELDAETEVLDPLRRDWKAGMLETARAIARSLEASGVS